MAISNCPKCWNTPCTCGYEYREWTVAERVALATAILGVPLYALNEVDIPERHPWPWGEEADK